MIQIINTSNAVYIAINLKMHVGHVPLQNMTPHSRVKGTERFLVYVNLRDGPNFQLLFRLSVSVYSACHFTHRSVKVKPNACSFNCKLAPSLMALSVKNVKGFVAPFRSIRRRNVKEFLVTTNMSFTCLLILLLPVSYRAL